MKQVDGFYYPDAEERLWRGHARYGDIEQHILPYCQNRRTCVQAGGAVGTWVQKLAEHFDYVFTAEPNLLQRECMTRNVTAFNYTCFPGAFWNLEGAGEMVEFQSNNLGAWYVSPCEYGTIELATIDSFDLKDVDLLCLDVEGAEVEALEGATDTIMRDRPVIVVEMKAATQQFYKRTDENLRRKVASFRYEFKTRFGKDELWLPID